MALASSGFPCRSPFSPPSLSRLEESRGQTEPPHGQRIIQRRAASHLGASKTQATDDNTDTQCLLSSVSWTLNGEMTQRLIEKEEVTNHSRNGDRRHRILDTGLKQLVLPS